ncbi:MAG: DUF2855 family protein [Blastomonas sp.]
MSERRWAINIDRDRISDAVLTSEAAADLPDGAIEVAIDCFAMTANNVTYAVFGKPAGLFGNDKGYWDFFAGRDDPGRLPVWGFATVIRSNADSVAVGESFYGYYPMASHAVLVPGRTSAHGFVDIAQHRADLPVIYNQYQKVAALPGYRQTDRDWWPVFRPLFLTGWLIADQFEDDGDYGAGQILIASASSKTAIGLGHALAQRANRPESVGLTSKAHVDHVRGLGIYDHVVAYDDIGTLDASRPAALVDMAGSGSVTRAVHEHFGDALQYSMVVGKSHWDAAAEGGAVPGPERQGFFAPGRSEKRIADWGAADFQRRIAEAWAGFMELAPRLATIDRRSGGEGAMTAYRAMLSGTADPQSALLVER